MSKIISYVSDTVNISPCSRGVESKHISEIDLCTEASEGAGIFKHVIVNRRTSIPLVIEEEILKRFFNAIFEQDRRDNRGGPVRQRTQLFNRRMFYFVIVKPKHTYFFGDCLVRLVISESLAAEPP